MAYKYENMLEGVFLERPNRFIAYVDLQGKKVKCHVKNTGRCRELLIPEKSIVYIQDHGENANRKTRYSLISVRKGERLVNMDSQVPNKVAMEWIQKENLFQNIVTLRGEKKYGDSRFDIYVEYKQGELLRKAFVEVKGVTLEDHGVVRFPDAPSVRAVKHLRELRKAVEEGYEAYVLFVVQMKNVKYFEPARELHKEFADTLFKVHREGVNVLAYDCEVTPDSIEICKKVPVVL